MGDQVKGDGDGKRSTSSSSNITNIMEYEEGAGDNSEGVLSINISSRYEADGDGLVISIT